MNSKPSLPTSESFVFSPAYEFPSVEDYVFFTLLSIITTHAYLNIFRPFHPIARKDINANREAEYERQVGTSLQASVAEWRSRNFKALEATISIDSRRKFLQKIVDNISLSFKAALVDIGAGQAALPNEFEQRLQTILETAYDWNTVIKRDILKYDFEPFFIEPGSEWDPEQMEPFERVRGTITKPVVSTVALGLIGSIALGGKRASYVQLKAKVLPAEWFRKASGRPTTYNNITPLPRNPPEAKQAGRTPPMTVGADVSKASAYDEKPKPNKGGLLCC